MAITVATTIKSKDGRVKRRACSLLGECVIEAGVSADYKLLAPYHYRNTGFPPAVHQIYRALHEPTGRVIGAIVYANAALNLSIRNRIFGDRYKIGGSTVTNKFRADRLNKEIELIIRVIVHPTFRGIGLGRRLIADTLPLRPYRYIEMSAAMGSINPFAEKAGMTATKVPHSEITARVLAALRSVGMSDADMANWKLIVRKLESLKGEQQDWLWAELERYATRWIKSRTGRKVTIDPESAARRVASNALLQTTYYLWDRDESR